MEKTVMVVDDEGGIRTSISDALLNHGYRVVQAMNGDDCVKKVAKSTPDLILLDIMMPGLPVKDIMSKVGDIKVIFVTVLRRDESEAKGLLKPKNIIDYIEKPFDISVLIKKVSRILGG